MTRVLYVTGWCRSGSTLLGNLLDAVPGVVHVGELHYLWQNGILGTGTNAQCGCGADVVDCALWDKVLSTVAPAGPGRIAEARAAVHDQAALRTRHTVRRLAEARGTRRRSPVAEAATSRITMLYRTIADVASADLVVDSSKFPAEAAALCGRTDVDARVLHLVRDPRATAYSWRRAKAYIPAMGVTRSSAYWTSFNLASERIGAQFPQRYLRMRYEDFVATPATALRSVLDLCEVSAASPVDERGRAVLDVNHTVTGNPDRLVRGEVRVRPDDTWRRDASRRDRLVAATLAAPLLWRYGYA